MTEVNIHQAKSTLSRLVAAAEDDGQETTLCRAGKPVARIVPMQTKTPPRPRKPGILQGKIEISDDFDEFTPSEAAIFGLNVSK